MALETTLLPIFITFVTLNLIQGLFTLPITPPKLIDGEKSRHEGHCLPNRQGHQLCPHAGYKKT